MTRLLVIDDDPVLTDQLKVALPPKGFEVFVANSGSEGLSIARHIEPDLIIVDLMMPGIDGWRVCQELRAFSRAPILVLSAVIDTDGVMRAMEGGADDYLVKPAPLGVLINHLNKLRIGT